MWLRIFSKKIFGRIMRPVPPDRAQKYMNVTRIIYFFSTTTLAILYYNLVVKGDTLKEKLESDIQNDLLMGKPVLEDFSPAHKRLREKGVKSAIIKDVSIGEDTQTIEYDRDLYLQELEKRAFEKAREAQRKALAEGKELPKGAIRLV